MPHHRCQTIPQHSFTEKHITGTVVRFGGKAGKRELKLLYVQYDEPEDGEEGQHKMVVCAQDYGKTWGLIVRFSTTSISHVCTLTHILL